MKHKFLFSILFICLFTIISAARTNAQDKPFNVSISVKDQTLLLNGNWLVKVKITNLSTAAMQTKDCGLIFRFKKTAPEIKSANALGDYALEDRLIKPGEAFEFEANLKNLRWVDPAKASVFVLERKDQAAYKPSLSGNYSLTATLNMNEEVGTDKGAARRMRVVSLTSNALGVKVALRADK